MKRRVIALLLASFMLISATAYSCIEAQAMETVVTSGAWAYFFEVAAAGAGVTFNGSAEADAFENEWEGYVASEGLYNHTHYAYDDVKEMDSTELENALNDADDDGQTLYQKFMRSLIDFLKMDDVSSGYGTVNFSWNSGLMDIIKDALGVITGSSSGLDSYLSDCVGKPVYVGSLPSYINGYEVVGMDTELVSSVLSGNKSYAITIVDWTSSHSRYFVGRVYVGDFSVIFSSYGCKLESLNGGTFDIYDGTISGYVESFRLSSSGVSSATLVVPYGYLFSSGLPIVLPDSSTYLSDYVFADSYPDVQEKGLLAVPFLADSFNIPETEEEREAVLTTIRNADTSEELINILADAGVIVGTDTGVEPDINDNVDIYPWLANILEMLTKIWTDVKAIPASIAVALDSALIGEDNGSYMISDTVIDKFPFCIPFDLVHCFQVVQAAPVAPVWEIPFVIDNQYIQYHHEITIDLSDWERPAVVIRYFILLIYIAGLVYATRYVIKG